MRRSNLKPSIRNGCIIKKWILPTIILFLSLCAYLWHILLHHAVFAWLDLLGIFEDKYSLSLRPTLWLSDVGPVLLSSTEGLEITIATEREREREILVKDKSCSYSIKTQNLSQTIDIPYFYTPMVVLYKLERCTVVVTYSAGMHHERGKQL